MKLKILIVCLIFILGVVGGILLDKNIATISFKTGELVSLVDVIVDNEMPSATKVIYTPRTKSWTFKRDIVYLRKE
jgi:hypothetical protein